MKCALLNSLAVRSVKDFNIDRTVFSEFDLVSASGIILTSERKILLQRRDAHLRRVPDFIGTFGGKIESGETARVALVREWREELELQVDPVAPMFLGARTGRFNDGTRVLNIRFFWHDEAGEIGTCHEGTPVMFAGATAALAARKLTRSTRWSLQECLRRNLIPA